MGKFKDKCDRCGKFDVLKGYNEQCLCNSCIGNPYLEQKFITEKKIIDPDTYIWPKEQLICDGQLSIFDLEVLENGQQRRNSKISK